MYEVILYAAIATIVCAMLYSVLGKPVGKGPESAIDPMKILEKPGDDKPAVIDPLEESGSFPDLAKIRKLDSAFALAVFQDQAEAAHSMILEAFADGDRGLLQELLTPSVYEVYEAAIVDREINNLTQVTDLARLFGTEIVDVSCKGSKARISVSFDAELASALKDAEGNVVQGDPDLLARSEEVWSFERDLKGKSPNWLLADVAASSDEDQEVDPSPDTTD